MPGENNKPEAVAGNDIAVEEMKPAELIEKATEFQKTAEQNYDLYIRSVAEIENLKKRFQKEKTELTKYANESIIKQLLSVVDNLEKAIAAAQGNDSANGVTEGIELTLKGLLDVLEKAGAKQIDANGKPFDPTFHEALFEQENNDVGPGTVIQELQKGYILNDRLIRPAMVVVSKKKI